MGKMHEKNKSVHIDLQSESFRHQDAWKVSFSPISPLIFDQNNCIVFSFCEHYLRIISWCLLCVYQTLTTCLPELNHQSFKNPRTGRSDCACPKTKEIFMFGFEWGGLSRRTKVVKWWKQTRRTVNLLICKPITNDFVNPASYHNALFESLGAKALRH